MQHQMKEWQQRMDSEEDYAEKKLKADKKTIEMPMIT